MNTKAWYNLGKVRRLKEIIQKIIQEEKDKWMQDAFNGNGEKGALHKDMKTNPNETLKISDIKKFRKKIQSKYGENEKMTPSDLKKVRRSTAAINAIESKKK